MHATIAEPAAAGAARRRPVAGGMHANITSRAHEQAAHGKGLAGPALLLPRAEGGAGHLRQPHHRLRGNATRRPARPRHRGHQRLLSAVLLRMVVAGEDLTHVAVGL